MSKVHPISNTNIIPNNINNNNNMKNNNVNNNNNNNNNNSIGNDNNNNNTIGSVKSSERSNDLLTNDSRANWGRIRASVQAVMAMRRTKSDAKLYGSMEPELWRKVNSTRSTQRVRNILYPSSKFITYWNLVVLLLLAYTVIVLPWRLAFVDENWNWIDVLVDSLFLMDIIITFFLAYENEEGNMVTDKKLIAIRYIKTWFLIDLVATFPFYFFVSNGASRASSLARIPRLFKIFRLLRVLKLLRVVKLHIFFERLEDSANVHPGVYRLFRVFCWFCGLSHICTCIWIFIAQTEAQDNSTNWIDIYGYENLSNAGQYNVALYWTISTLTGTGLGDIVPQSHLERIYTSLVMLCGVLFLAYITATIASVFSSLDVRASHFRTQLESLGAFMKSARLPLDLRSKLTKHVRYAYRQPPNFADSQQILTNVPKHLRKEVLTWVHRDLFRDCSFFRQVPDQDFISEVVMHLVPTRYLCGQTIGSYGQPVTDWFIIKNGAVEAQSQHDASPYMVFRAGSTFGETGLLLSGTWGATMRAIEDTDILSVPSRKLRPLLAEYPATKKHMQEIAIERQKRLLNKKMKHDDSVSTWDLYDETLKVLRSRTVFNSLARTYNEKDVQKEFVKSPRHSVLENKNNAISLAAATVDEDETSISEYGTDEESLKLDRTERRSTIDKSPLPTILSGTEQTDFPDSKLPQNINITLGSEKTKHRRVISLPINRSSSNAVTIQDFQDLTSQISELEKQVDTMINRQEQVLNAVQAIIPY